MAIKDLMKATKADRYTQDGRDKLNEALQADVEDRTYKTGEISEKTGLQKQPDGSWAPPKETRYGKVQQNKEGKWGVQQKLGKGSQFIEHKNEKDASKALANYTAGYNTTERSKQDQHSNEARQIKQWNKETEKIAKGNNAERRAEHAAQFQSKPAEKKRPKNIRWDRNNMQTMHEHAEYITPQQADNFYHQYGLDKTGEHKDSKGWLIKEYKNDDGDIYRAKYNQENKYIGYDFLPKGSAENPGEESKPAEENKTSAPAPKKAQSVNSIKGYLENNFWSRPEDFESEIKEAGWDVEEMNNEYAVISNDKGSQYEVRFADHGDGRDLTMKTFKSLYIDEDDDDELEDRAPRKLTGDCKIRVRKA